MPSIVLWITVIGLAIVVVAISLSVGDVLLKRPDNAPVRLLAATAVPARVPTRVQEPAAVAPATDPMIGGGGVGYLDEPAPTRRAFVSTPAASAPVGVGYLDEPAPTSRASVPTPAGSAPVGVGYMDV